MPGNFVYHVQNNGTVYANMTGNVELNGWFNKEHLNMTGGVYPEDQYYLMTNWTPGLLDIGFYNVDTTINYGRYNQSQSIVTHDKVFVFPIWIIILILLVVVIYLLRKKEVSSPVKIKIERKK